MKTGWYVTKTVCCSWSGRASTGRRPRVDWWCENQAGDIAIHYRGQSLHFRELSAAATALSEGRGVPLPRAPFPETSSDGSQAPPLSCRQSSLEARLAEYENSRLLSRMVTRGHFYCGEDGETSIVV